MKLERLPIMLVVVIVDPALVVAYWVGEGPIRWFLMGVASTATVGAMVAALALLFGKRPGARMVLYERGKEPTELV